MMTHVKRNAQRIAFTKPSHIECALQYRNPTAFPTQSFNCGNHSKENSLYYAQRNIGLAEISRYLRAVERLSILSGRFYHA